MQWRLILSLRPLFNFRYSSLGFPLLESFFGFVYFKVHTVSEMNDPSYYNVSTVSRQRIVTNHCYDCQGIVLILALFTSTSTVYVTNFRLVKDAWHPRSLSNLERLVLLYLEHFFGVNFRFTLYVPVMSEVMFKRILLVVLLVLGISLPSTHAQCSTNFVSGTDYFPSKVSFGRFKLDCLIRALDSV